MLQRRHVHVHVHVSILLATAFAFVAACGSNDRQSFTGAPGGPRPNSSSGDSPAFGALDQDGGVTKGPCVNLACQQQSCSGGATTTLSGTVYDPAGNNPLYNVVVYVPNAPLEPLPKGATCASCNSLYSGSPLVATTTDATGTFTLANVPAGSNIPVVVQVGKWRKQIVIPTVAACTANTVPDKALRLPKNHFEGDMPDIAISTGGADTLECLLRRVGIDASEYNPGASGAGRIHIFHGSPDDGGPFSWLGESGAPDTSPPAPDSATSLWSSTATLMDYDIVLLSCEGDETEGANQQALFDYAAAGGRVFASHFHYAWFNSGPFGNQNLATWSPGTNDMGDVHGAIVTTLDNGAPFPKGQALFDWLGNVGALKNGELPIKQARHNADVGASHPASQAWIRANASASPAHATQYFTFNTPFGWKPEDQCGRVVFSDLHVGAASGDYQDSSSVVPKGCNDGELSPQEKALEFMLFDLSSCVTPDDQAPAIPPITPR